MKKVNILLLLVLLGACKKSDNTTPANNNPVVPANPTPTPTNNCDTSLLLSIEFNGNFKDSSCNVKDVINLNTSWTADRNAHAYKAVQFAASSKVEVPNDSLLHPNFPFTLSFWVNPADSSSYGNSFYTSCINSNGSGNYGFNVGTTGSGVIGVSYGDGSVNGVTNTFSSLAIRSGRWTHVAVVFFALGDVRIYLNGNQDSGTNTYPNLATGITYLPLSDAAATGRIGGDGTYTGKMDKVKIWRRVLTNTEIYTEYMRTN